MKLLISFLVITAILFNSCIDSCDNLPQAYSKEDAEYLPYVYDQKLVFQDSLGVLDTMRISYFTQYPVVENINDCTIETEYIDCKIATTEPDSFGTNLEIVFNVNQTSLLEVGNDMRIDNFVPSVNAGYSYGNNIQILGKTFTAFLALTCVDNTCGPVLEVVFAKGKGLVALRNQEGWKVLAD